MAAALVAVRRWARRGPIPERPAPDPALLERVRQEALADDADADASGCEGEALMAGDLAAEDADQVARMLTEARKRLAAQGAGPPPARPLGRTRPS